ncbi:MAG TPA: hypothetical protein VFV75_12500 [Candidatus Polarisedimenticolaceae bacterium]|nr:hypothetical protein [Candidatus Polarisedimenticolaceae bacterium]
MIEALQVVLVLMLRLALTPQAGTASANTVASRQAEPEPVRSEDAASKAAELYADRKFEKALPEAEEAVAQAWKEFGGDDYHTIAAEEFLAHLAVLNKDVDRARAIREETDRKLERLANPAIAEKVKVTRAEEYKETMPAGKGN